MARGALHRLAILYALAVALACPSVLDASEGEPPPSPAGDQTGAPAANGAPTAQPPRAEQPAGVAPPAAGSQQPDPATPGPPEGAPQAAPGEAAPPLDPAAGVKARAAASGSVTMKEFSFSPSTVTVDAGESVTWTNGGREAHTATGDGFDTGTLKPGESGSATFSPAGSFSYACSIHPDMQGTVRVLSASGDGGGAESPPVVGGADSEPGSSPDGGTAGGPTLPASGLDAGLLGILGAALVALGIGLRRRTAAG